MVEKNGYYGDDITMLTMEQIVVEPPADGEIADPTAWFGSPGVFEIEIGCGKGGFLLFRAKADPSVRLLGIEWANKYFRHCSDRMARRGITNVRVMRTDAKSFVMQHLPPACVSVLHVYHPDPWPKKRHHKRRLIQPDFVDAAIRALAPDGLWRIQSDHEPYVAQIRRLLESRAELRETSWMDSAEPGNLDWNGTNFEIKYSRQGRVIYRFAFCKR